jgi:hypothetical protein
MVSKCQLQRDKYQTWVLDPRVLNKQCAEKSSKRTAEGSSKKVKSIYDAMYEKCEYAAAFHIYHKLKGNVSSSHADLKGINRGSSASVKTDPGLCNFHTHPIECYLQEKTAWGWPSGEDIRECIRFMLSGNVIHFVFTLEGIYGIQVNPTFLHALRELENDLLRGITISMIESYFKSTHGFRNLEYLMKPGTTMCTPKDWVHFANEFRLNNILDHKNSNKCTKSLGCNGFPDTHVPTGTIPFHKYLEQYELDPYTMNASGNLKTYEKEQQFTKAALQSAKFLAEHFRKYTNPKQGYKTGQWFKCTFYENQVKINNAYINISDWITSNISAKDINDFWKYVSKHKSDELFRFHPHVIEFKGYQLQGPNGCQIKK